MTVEMMKHAFWENWSSGGIFARSGKYNWLDFNIVIVLWGTIINS